MESRGGVLVSRSVPRLDDVSTLTLLLVFFLFSARFSAAQRRGTLYATPPHPATWLSRRCLRNTAVIMLPA